MVFFDGLGLIVRERHIYKTLTKASLSNTTAVNTLLLT